MDLIKRKLETAIKSSIKNSQITIIYGLRQVGKTTLIQKILEEHKSNVLKLSGDLKSDREILGEDNLEELVGTLESGQVLFVDEAQRVENIGLVSKYIADNCDVKIILTGSSSFDLANKIKEPLTGRSNEFHLLPLSYFEQKRYAVKHIKQKSLESNLLFGSLPAVFLSNNNEKLLKLNQLSGSYLYKDILDFQDIRNSNKLEDILQVLSNNLGQITSMNNLAQLSEMNRRTLLKYMDLLENNYIVYGLRPYGKRLNRQINTKMKYYFTDLGIRNTYNNFSKIDSRVDKGALFENFIVNEFKKSFSNNNVLFSKFYFYRNYDGQEVDLIITSGKSTYAIEIKYSEKAKARIPNDLPVDDSCYTSVVNRLNFDIEIEVITKRCLDEQTFA
jgi:predicted AAA+ superfamily ATPase